MATKMNGKAEIRANNGQGMIDANRMTDTEMPVVVGDSLVLAVVEAKVVALMATEAVEARGMIEMVEEATDTWTTDKMLIELLVVHQVGGLVCKLKVFFR